MSSTYNQRNPAVKRLMREAVELKAPSEMYFAQPLEDNLFEWHFTVRGPSDTEFNGGIYHGRIILPPEYPMKPPSILLLTPNGRFELNKKICLSISGYHPESWQPSWSIRTALLAIIGFMPTPGAGALGALDYSADERQVLAKKSALWKCPTCNIQMSEVLLPLTDASSMSKAEAQQLAAQISFKGSGSTSEENRVPIVVDAQSVSTTLTPVTSQLSLGHDAPLGSLIHPSSASLRTVDSSASFNDDNRSIVGDLADVQQEVMAVRRRLEGSIPAFTLSPAPSVQPANQNRAAVIGSPTVTCFIWFAAVMIAVLLFRRFYFLEDGQDEFFGNLG